MTKVEAIKALLRTNGGAANWETIYENIEKHYPEAKSGQYWQEGLRGVVYREMRYGRNFKLVDRGIIALQEPTGLQA